MAGRPGRPPRSEVYERLDFQIQELWSRMGGLPNPLEPPTSGPGSGMRRPTTRLRSRATPSP